MCQSPPKAACSGLALAKADAVPMDAGDIVLHPCAWSLVESHPVLYGQSSIPDTLHLSTCDGWCFSGWLTFARPVPGPACALLLQPLP
jgi:hypothetical protein